jgi:hypothetical protein
VSDIRYPEFLASLENTRYPFIATASLSNGSVSFLEGTFLDAHLYAVGGGKRYYISKVVVESDQCTITIGDDQDVASLTGVVGIPVTTSAVRLTDIYGRPGGILVSEPDRLAVLSAWGVGTHTFERAQTEFCVTCQMPIPDPGVTGFRLENGDILSGRVWFVGDDGVILSTSVINDKNGNPFDRLRIDAVGDPLYLQRLCTSENLFVPVNPVRTIRVINGDYSFDCQPDEQGNFNIQMNDSLAADAALRIRTTPEGIVFEVEGSTPVQNNNV